MKKVCLILFLAALYVPSVQAQQYAVKVTGSDTMAGYFSYRIPLERYAIPAVEITGIAYGTPGGMSSDSQQKATFPKVGITLGKERKKPFAVLRFPAYRDAGTGDARRVLTDVSFTVTESGDSSRRYEPKLRTTQASSPLASGNWYKIAVSTTDVYKIDFDFLKNKLGIDPNTIGCDQIRIFGKGGNMLPEKNLSPFNDGLRENAIAVYDNDNNGIFSQGDYILFYASGPIGWSYDSLSRSFVHSKNLYSDKGYYFLNFDQGQGQRVSNASGTNAANVTVTSFDDHLVHEADSFNPGQLGKRWWGERFGSNLNLPTSQTFNFDLGPVTDASFKITVGAASASTSNFNILLDGTAVSTLQLASSELREIPMQPGEYSWSQAYGNARATLRLDYESLSAAGTGYLDYIEINTRRQLTMNAATLSFRDRNSVSAGNTAQYRLSNAASTIQVWDITDARSPVKMNGSMEGNTYAFTQDASTLHEFIAVNSNALPLPEYVGKIANQDLHAGGVPQYVIVTHPTFLAQASQLAEFHTSRGLYTIVTTTEQIYNEFSSGGQDISAIRDYLRMFYMKAGSETEMPKYVLLFGDASFDYKDRVPNNTNFVPTYESAQSTSPLTSYLNDDFFVFLDDNEDIEDIGIANTLDAGIGRLPVKSAQEAADVVAKIKNYKSPASLGPWRISAMFIADNEDNAGPHMEDGEIMSSIVTANSGNIYNIAKVYLDNTRFISTPAGTRAPDANKLINDQIFRGAMLVNYNGHGNTQVLAHERIVTADDYRQWANADKLPFIITATCDFGRFDHPSYVSAGEELVLMPKRGVIAALTTTQLVYQFANRVINQQFMDAQFKRTPNGWNAYGDAFRIAKNLTYEKTPDPGTLYNFRKFALLGDPALTPNFPEYYIRRQELKDLATGQITDSVNALGAYSIAGDVTDANGNTLRDFNGKIYVTLYDKPQTYPTITGIGKTYNLQNNIIYKGRASVNAGKFSFEFIAPKDITYSFGSGKLSAYADNGSEDAAGADTTVIIGGYSDNPVIENRPPIVRPYIYDSLFKNGEVTGSNTMLYAILEDETGINVSGNNVGHDLIGILDENVASPYNMNDYYETELNTYKRGYVNFPLKGIPDGFHRLRVKAWDANNNSGEGNVYFKVVSGHVTVIDELMNYPNPFSDRTNFVFVHNHPDEDIRVEINIYNLAGVLVKAIRAPIYATGSHSGEVQWDGTGDNGGKLPSGTYIYRINVVSQEGVRGLGFQRLVLRN